MIFNGVARKGSPSQYDRILALLVFQEVSKPGF
jgi:hypothetical protein